MDLHCDRGAAAAGGFGCLLVARAQSGESRSAGGAQVRMKENLFKSMALVAMLMFGIFLLTPSLRSQEKAGRSNWTWNNSDGGQKIEVKVENKVEFNDDYSDVSTVIDDGALRIYDSRGPRTFRLVVTRGVGGELRRDYSVDGQNRSFDAEGQAWLRRVLLQAVREG